MNLFCSATTQDLEKAKKPHRYKDNNGGIIMPIYSNYGKTL
jgi:hypothetical protein